MFVYVFIINGEIVSRFENKWPHQLIKLFNENLKGHLDKDDKIYEMYVKNDTNETLVSYTNNIFLYKAKQNSD